METFGIQASYLFGGAFLLVVVAIIVYMRFFRDKGKKLGL